MELPKPSRMSLHVAVIGAGAAGLATARELLREGHTVTVFEQSDCVGGLWNYTPACEEWDLLGREPQRPRVHSSIYESLRVNLPRQVMSFSDFPFIPAAIPGGSKDARWYPHHTEVQAWLERFAETFGLLDVIQFRRRVVWAEPAWEGRDKSSDVASLSTAPRWRVTTEPVTDDAGQSSQINTSKGHATTSMAQPPSTKQRTGPATDSVAEPPLNGTTKLLAAPTKSSSLEDQPQASLAPGHGHHQNGLGSKAPIADLQQGRQTTVFDAVISCVGNYTEPNLPEVTGMKTWRGHQMHSHNYRSNSRFANQVVVVVGNMFSGTELAREVAGSAKQVCHSARAWQWEVQDKQPPNLQTVAMLTELRNEGRTAVFADGTTVQGVDSVLYCTGYQYAYPWLAPPDLLRTEGMRVDPLYKHVLHPVLAPTLAFVGLLWKNVPYPQMEMQAKWVARLLSGRASLPSRTEMLADTQAFYKELQQAGVRVLDTHNQAAPGQPWDQWTYNAWLAKACGPDVAPPETWRTQLLGSACLGILSRPDTFRDVWPDSDLPLYAAADKACLAMLKSKPQGLG